MDDTVKVNRLYLPYFYTCRLGLFCIQHDLIGVLMCPFSMFVCLVFMTFMFAMIVSFMQSFMPVMVMMSRLMTSTRNKASSTYKP